MDAFGEGFKVAHALYFVIGQLDVKVIFQPGKQIQRLQTVDSQLLVKIVTGFKRLVRHLKLFCRQVQNFLGGLFQCAHMASIYHSRREKENGAGGAV